MAQDDVKRALEAMLADESIAEQMAGGDFSGVAGLDLTEDEQLIVQDAAADLPEAAEVSGFASDIFAKIGDIKGESMDDKWRGLATSKMIIAVNYASGKKTI